MKLFKIILAVIIIIAAFKILPTVISFGIIGIVGIAFVLIPIVLIGGLWALIKNCKA